MNSDKIQIAVKIVWMKEDELTFKKTFITRCFLLKLRTGEILFKAHFPFFLKEGHKKASEWLA